MSQKYLTLAGIIGASIIGSVTYYSMYEGRAPSSSTKGLSFKNYTRSYFALGEHVSYSGLTNKTGEDDKYVRRLFGKLIQKADEVSRDDLYNYDIGVYRNYHSFLLAAIQVPFHESGLIHFRKVNSDICSDYSNNIADPIHEKDFANKYYPAQIQKLKSEMGVTTKKSQQDTISRKIRLAKVRKSNADYLYKNLKAFLKVSVVNNPFPHCDKINNKDKVQQILFSNDYADIGLMMINAKAHPKVMKSGDIFHVDRVIDYGVNHLYQRGFLKIAKNSNSYNCLKGLEKNNPYEYAKRLVRGAWAGRYNSGSAIKTCRFLNKSDRFYSNDVAFNKNLNKILSESKYISYYHKYLPEHSIERKAFEELIANVKNQTNKREFIDTVLITNYDDQDIQYKSTKELREKEATTLVDAIMSDDLKQNVADSGKDRVLDNTIVVNDSEGDLPVNSEDEYTYVVVGKNFNIRLSPKIENNICTNTAKKENHPVKIALVEKMANGFSKISSFNLEDIIDKEKCRDADFLYVSTSALKEVKDYEINGKVRITSMVYARSKPSSTNSTKLAILNPDTIFAKTDEIIKHDKYRWVQIVLDDGKKAWVYANRNVEDI